MALEREGVNERKIRALAVEFAGAMNNKITGAEKERKLFASAICPVGESVFFDCLKGKTIYKIEGSELATQIFFDEFKGLVAGGTYLLNPLEPKHLDGILAGDVAIVKDVGFEKEFEVLNLHEFEKFEYEKEIVEERNGVVLETAFAVEELNKAREYHLQLEKYFVGAMDFKNNEMLYGKIVRELFEA